MRKKITAVIYALSAAIFYAVNVPLSKILLKNIDPVFMAGLLYLGAGAGVGIFYSFHKHDAHKNLDKKDLPYVIGMILLDSIAPIFLMAGVKFGTASGASLIGNFEIAATALFAAMFFHEKISAVLIGAISLIRFSGLILSYEGSGENILIFSKGSLLVAAATLCWGLENNCTRNISNKNTYQIVTVKGIFSGLCSIITAFAVHEKIPDLIYIFPVLLLGFISYGLSIFTYIRAQEMLGAAKTSAYYAAAPFVGAIFSFIVLKEPVSLRYIAAFFIMAAGTALVIYDTLRQNHSHEHNHIFTHVHGGTLHTHVIIHTHQHNHYINSDKHEHKHTLQELEKFFRESIIA